MKLYRNVLKIGDKNRLVVTINQEEGKEVIEQVAVKQCHHIQMLDRSGSMYESLNELIDNVQKTFDVMGKNDLITIVWFSSKGEFRTLVKGMKKSPELIKKMDELRHTVGLTCFSDPIKEVKTIVEEMYSLCPNINITLFTDGQPCGIPWSLEEEVKISLDLVHAIRDKIIAFNCVGYGNYYNEPFLRQLSEQSDFGSFMHSRNIGEYMTIFENNFERITGSRVESIDINAHGADVFYLTRNFCKTSIALMKLSKLDKEKNQFFLVGQQDCDFTFEYNGQTYNSKDIKEKSSDPTMTNLLYAMVYSNYYIGARRESLDVLAKNLLDKHLIDSHMAAFTRDEVATHVELLNSSLLIPARRMQDGVAKKNYIPKKDAFCVMDVLNTLASGESLFLPYHKEMEKYNRITKETKIEHDRFKGMFDKASGKFDDIQFNKSRCNLSLKFTIPGTIELNKATAERVGLPEVFETYTWKNHTLIKDGFLNMKTIVALVNINTFNYLQKKMKNIFLTSGDMDMMMRFEKEQNDKCYFIVIDLTKLPVINQTYDEDVSVDQIFQLSSDLLRYTCHQKIINDAIKTAYEKDPSLRVIGSKHEFTADQMKCLEEHGIAKDGSYSGVQKSTIKTPDGDFYTTREIEFVFKGASSLPTIEEAKDQKKTGITMDIMRRAIVVNTANVSAKKFDINKPSKTYIDFMKAELRTVKNLIFNIRNTFAGIKMAKLLTGDWFRGFQKDQKGIEFVEIDSKILYLKTKIATEKL